MSLWFTVNCKSTPLLTIHLEEHVANVPNAISFCGANRVAQIYFGPSHKHRPGLMPSNSIESEPHFETLCLPKHTTLKQKATISCGYRFSLLLENPLAEDKRIAFEVPDKRDWCFSRHSENSLFCEPNWAWAETRDAFRMLHSKRSSSISQCDRCCRVDLWQGKKRLGKFHCAKLGSSPLSCYTRWDIPDLSDFLSRLRRNSKGRISETKTDFSFPNAPRVAKYVRMLLWETRSGHQLL